MKKRKFILKLKSLFNDYKGIPKEERGIPMMAVITDNGVIIGGEYNTKASGKNKRVQQSGHAEAILARNFISECKNPIIYSLVEPCESCVDTILNSGDCQVFFILKNNNIIDRKYQKKIKLKQVKLNNLEISHIELLIQEWEEYQKFNDTRHGKIIDSEGEF